MDSLRLQVLISKSWSSIMSENILFIEDEHCDTTDEDMFYRVARIDNIAPPEALLVRVCLRGTMTASKKYIMQPFTLWVHEYQGKSVSMTLDVDSTASPCYRLPPLHSVILWTEPAAINNMKYFEYVVRELPGHSLTVGCPIIVNTGVTPDGRKVIDEAGGVLRFQWAPLSDEDNLNDEARWHIGMVTRKTLIVPRWRCYPSWFSLPSTSSTISTGRGAKGSGDRAHISASVSSSLSLRDTFALEFLVANMTSLGRSNTPGKHSRDSLSCDCDTATSAYFRLFAPFPRSPKQPPDLHNGG